MTKYGLQNSISEITESPEGFGFDHFLAAICWGTLTGTLAMMAVLMWAAGFDFDLSAIGAALLIIGLITAVFTFLSMLVIGLPLTWFLHTIEQESAAGYAVAGAFAGFLVIAVTFEAHREPAEMLWFPAVGALAGLVCAYRWGTWREALFLAADPEPEPRSKRSNPIHDLTH